MRRAGCWLIQLGVESGNQDILNTIRKGITLKQVERACKMAYEERFEVKRQDLLNQYVAQKDLLIRENTATRDILESKIEALEADMEKQLQRALDNPLANR